MVSGRTGQQFRAQLVGAMTVVGAVLLAAIVATLVLTRRMIAPMRQLMRAAKAVGSGNLDIHVPVRSSDELGLLTHTFNHMIQRLGQAQGEVASYQRTLEDKVAQRTKELEIATAQAYRLAQHDILTGLPNRSLLNQQSDSCSPGTARPPSCRCLFRDSDHFKRIRHAGSLAATSCSRQSPSGCRCGAQSASCLLGALIFVFYRARPAHVTFVRP